MCPKPWHPNLHPQEPWRRRHLAALWGRLGAALGYEAVSPIVPLIVGAETAAVAACAALLARGLHVPAIRPPTVPAGTSRCVLCLQSYIFSSVIQYVDDMGYISSLRLHVLAIRPPTVPARTSR